MLHPQSVCKDIRSIKHVDAIYNYGCCAFVYMWCLGIDPTDITAIQTVDDLISSHAIDNECTVDWAKMGKALTGRDIEVEKVPINNILSIKERTPVMYSYKGKHHFVGVENGMIVFNPLEESYCVNNGRPTEMRVIKIKGLAK